MPPKVKVSKQEIVESAVSVVCQDGAGALNARVVAQMLGCSTQPVFSNFATMEELRLAVAQEAYRRYQAYGRCEAESGQYPPYKASGMAYIRFAKEEKELFKLLYMCDRAGAPTPENEGDFLQMTAFVHQNTGLGDDAAKRFHLEMWTVVHGFATMAATGFMALDEQLIADAITDIYQGLRTRFGC